MIFDVFSLILLLSLSVEAASIRRTIPRAVNLITSRTSKYHASNRDRHHSAGQVKCENPLFSDYNLYLSDEELMKRLIRGPAPLHVLLDPEYFADVVRRGKHGLCSQLLRNGQKIKLIDKDGNNLLVRIIENKASYLIGILMETNHDETMAALNVKDAKTGHTPMSMAIELEDRIAIYEIIDPRPQI